MPKTLIAGRNTCNPQFYFLFTQSQKGHMTVKEEAIYCGQDDGLFPAQSPFLSALNNTI